LFNDFNTARFGKNTGIHPVVVFTLTTECSVVKRLRFFVVESRAANKNIYIAVWKDMGY